MMQIIGIKRVLLLVILFAANAAIAAATYMYVVPENMSLERQLRSAKAQINNKRNETERLRNDFEQIQKRKEQFETLEKAGFISDQNRLVARRRITEIQQYSGVLRAGYDIKPANIVNTRDTEAINYVVLSSPITIDVEAMDDMDLFSFVYWMENAFPGHMSPTKITFQRDLDVNEASLRQIGSGVPTTLVKGKIDFIWRTMVPKKDVVGEGELMPEEY